MPDDLEACVRGAARCGECFFIGRETKAAGPGGVYCDYCQDRRYVLTAAAVARAANAMATEALGGEGESFERDALLRVFVVALGEKLEGA